MEGEWVGMGCGEVELVGLVVVFVEEEDGLGSEVVDADELGSLGVGGGTCRRGVFWRMMSVRRWNLRC